MIIQDSFCVFYVTRKENTQTLYIDHIVASSLSLAAQEVELSLVFDQIQVLAIMPLGSTETWKEVAKTLKRELHLGRVMYTETLISGEIPGHIELE